MAKSLEGFIINEFVRALDLRLKPLEKRIAKVEAALNIAAGELAKLDKPKNDQQEIRLVTLSEARRRLLVNANALNRLIENGTLKSVTTPNGRRKVLETSLNEYIRQAAS